MLVASAKSGMGFRSAWGSELPRGSAKKSQFQTHVDVGSQWPSPIPPLSNGTAATCNFPEAAIARPQD